MGVTKTKAVFKTSDGLEFLKEKDATAHQKVLDAERDFKDACRTYGEALLSEAKTADGETVELSLMRDYWYVHPGFVNQMPRLVSVSFYRWNCNYEDRNGLTIWVTDDERRIYHYPVRELYADELKAKAALKAARYKAIEEFTRETESMS